jgi:hypothetical protein
LLAAEQDLIRCQADAAACRRVLPDHESALTAASRHVAELAAARDDAHRACVLDIVRVHIAAHYLPTMLGVLGVAAWEAGPLQHGARPDDCRRGRQAAQLEPGCR